MTTDPRRALAALALVPVTAGAFAGAVAWAADRPGQTAADVEPGADVQPVSALAPAAATTVPAAAPATEQAAGQPATPTPTAGALDPRDAALTAQLEALRTRLAELQAQVGARQAEAASAAQAAAQAAASRASSGSSGSSGSSTAQRSAPAPRPAPPVDTTTRASG